MKATIAAMDGHRATVQQKLMLEPLAAPPVELEDETVEDEPNLQEIEDEIVAHADMVIDGTPAAIMEEPATPVDMDRVSENEDTTQDEDGDATITQSAKDVECAAMRPMPPPPPRPPRDRKSVV